MKKTILLVEDDFIIGMAEAKKIRGFGYEVLIANSGEKAIRTASENLDIDLVLMDVHLGPGMDGTEAARKILDKKDIPIVFLTSRSRQDFEKQLTGIAHYGYLAKNAYATSQRSYIAEAFGLQTCRAGRDEN